MQHRINLFFHVLSLVVRNFLLVVGSRLEASFEEREVRSRQESVPQNKQQRREILIKNTTVLETGRIFDLFMSTALDSKKSN